MFKFYSSRKWVSLSDLYILNIVYAILYNSRVLLGENVWKKNDIVKLNVERNIFQSISINLTFSYKRLNNYWPNCKQFDEN